MSNTSNIEQYFATSILDCFEDLLEDKDIDIPSDDRNGEDGEARLYGTEYFELEQMIIEILEQFRKEVEREADAGEQLTDIAIAS